MTLYRCAWLIITLLLTRDRRAIQSHRCEAVQLRRQLADTNPAFLPDLATTLNNLGNRYSEVGRRQDDRGDYHT